MTDHDALQEIRDAFRALTGRDIEDYPRPKVHPEQEEADNRRIERAERDREFVRIYGDGR